MCRWGWERGETSKEEGRKEKGRIGVGVEEEVFDKSWKGRGGGETTRDGVGVSLDRCVSRLHSSAWEEGESEGAWPLALVGGRGERRGVREETRPRGVKIGAASASLRSCTFAVALIFSCPHTPHPFLCHGLLLDACAIMRSNRRRQKPSYCRAAHLLFLCPRAFDVFSCFFVFLSVFAL